MKKFLIVALMAIAGVAFVAAQPRAVGVNLGGGLGLSYEHGFGSSTMLDVAVDVPLLPSVWGIGGHVTYDWIDPFNAPVPWNNRGEWHWYMGVGGAAGIYGFNNVCWHAGVAGHVGIEYDFWFPLQLSLDWRPELGVSDYNSKDSSAHKIGFGLEGLYGIALGVRYKI